jgi:catechol 2,3-dioxygenase-like lactoylglutathione lyase family enzyme
MSTEVHAMLGVADVPRSVAWYRALFDCESGHGGPEFDRLVRDGQTLVLLHRRGAPEHPSLRDFDGTAPGRGVILWFTVDDVDAAWARARELGAPVVDPLHENVDADHREFALADPDGYVVAVCGPR